MLLFKKSSLFFFVSVLTFISILGIPELRAMEDDGHATSRDALLFYYPLSQRGNNLLKTHALIQNEGPLLNEVVRRYEEKTVTLFDQERKDFCRKLNVLADRYLGRANPNPDFGKAAVCYRNAEKLGDPDARERYTGLMEQVKNRFRLDSRAEKAQLENLTLVYLREARGDDIELLKMLAERAPNYGHAAQLYLKIEELGNEEGRTLFHAHLDRFKDFSYTGAAELAKRIFPICLQEMENDEKVRAFLEKNYSSSFFLKGVFSYYVEKGGAASINAAMKLCEQYKSKSHLDASDLLPLIEFFSQRADAGDLDACHKVIEMSTSFGNSIRYDIGVKYTLKAVELGDKKAREALYHLLRNIKTSWYPSSEQVMNFFPLCLQEIEKGDKELETILDKHYSNSTFLSGVIAYYIKEGDEASLKTAVAIYDQYKAVSQIEASALNNLRRCFTSKANAGDLGACRRVIEMSKGFGRSVQYQPAIEYYIKAIELGDGEAREGLYQLLEKADQNLSEQGLSQSSLQWIERQNDARLFYLLGNAYSKMRFLNDLKIASAYYFKSIALGHVQSKDALKVPLDKLKKISSKDRKKYADQFVAEIFPLYLREAERDSYFYRALANEYLSGELVERDVAQAVDFSLKAGRMEKQSIRAIYSRILKDIVQNSQDVFATVREVFKAEEQRENTDSLGALLLGELCTVGMGNGKGVDRGNAEAYFMKAESRQDVQSHMAFAKMHAEGHPHFAGKVNLSLAAESYVKAHALGHAEAHTKLCALFDKVTTLKGEEREEQLKALVALVEAEANATRDPQLLMVLGNPFARPDIDRDTQVLYYVKAARWGHPDALSVVEKLYETLERQFSKDKLRTAFTPLLAYYLECADNGNDSFNLKIAEMYEKVFTQGQDAGKAVEWYEKELIRLTALAVKDDQKAYDDVIELRKILQSKPHAPDETFRLAKPFFELELKKAQEGNPKSKYYVGKAYTSRNGTPRDVEQAALWYFRIMAEDNSDLFIRAQLKSYALYRSVKRDNPEELEKLFPLYLAEAEKGNPYAQYIVAKMYFNGRGVSNDDGKALHWFERALENKVPGAAKGLGLLYQLARGVALDMDRAFAYYKQEQSAKRIKMFIKRKLPEPEKETKFTWENFKEGFDIFRKAYAQPSIYTDPHQSLFVKQSPLGRMMALVEEGMNSLSQIHVEDLQLRQPGFLLTALTVKQPVPGFIETFEYDSMAYTSIGKENCQQAEKIKDALMKFQLCESDASKIIEDCTNSIRVNDSKLMTLSALAIGDEKITKKYIRLSTAQERLKSDKSRAQIYRDTALYLREYLKLAPRRNAEFFSPEEFGFLR
jgi:TPR repeat protein